MTIHTGNHSFVVVPEFEDYGLLIGVPLVTAAFWRVRRRAAPQSPARAYSIAAN